MFLFLEGRRHDSGMLAESRLLPLLDRHAVSPVGLPMCIYGDPAYPIRAPLISPYRNVVLIPEMEAFNTSMSQVQEAVEWLFNDVATSNSSSWALDWRLDSAWRTASFSLRKSKVSLPLLQVFLGLDSVSSNRFLVSLGCSHIFFLISSPAARSASAFCLLLCFCLFPFFRYFFH